MGRWYCKGQCEVGQRHFYKKGHPYGCPFLVYISIAALLSVRWRLGRTPRGITFSDATRDLSLQVLSNLQQL